MDHGTRERASYAGTRCSVDSSPSTLVPATEYTYESSEATTLYEKEVICDTDSCGLSATDNVEDGSHKLTHKCYLDAHYDYGKPFGCSVWALWNNDLINNKECQPAPPPSLRKFHHLKATLSGLVTLVSDYKTRKRLSAAELRVEQCRKNYHPLSVKELQSLYEYLRQLERRRKKFAFAALTLRLSVLDFLFDILDTPILFSEQRKNFYREVWLDLEYESPIHFNSDTHKQIMELKQKIFIRVLDELPVNRTISEIIPNGSSVVQALCKELAYGSGVYAVQKALTQISRTKWGHGELLHLSLQFSFPKEKEKRSNLIIDCITRLLSFRNAFSHAMAFRIFGRVAEFNDKIHVLLTGPLGVSWLVDRLSEQSYTRQTGYRSYRQIETYCCALTTACCTKKLVNCVLQHDIVFTLLHLVEMFTARDEAMHSEIEDNQQDDCDIELDQIACCELIILLMKTPSGKKQFFDAGGVAVLEPFMNDPNRSFAGWKLSLKLTAIGGLLH